MRKAMLFASAVVLVCASSAIAQNVPSKPTAEHKKLEYFVGKWTTTGDMKPSPFGPGGKITTTDACEWFQGGFAVVCRTEGKGPTGPVKSIGIMGYSTDQKVYTYYGVDNTAMTMASIPKGTVEGDTWTFNDEGTMGGQPYKGRFVLKTSPGSYTFKWEVLGPDQKWMPIIEGTSSKAK
jgi:hypothetical protein